MPELVGLTRLSRRGVLRMAGRDTINFLHAMSTNDVNSADTRALQYTAFLSPKGRVLYDAVLHHDVEASVPTVLIEMDRALIPKAIEHFKEYKLRKKVTFEDVSKEMQVVVASVGGVEVSHDALVAPWRRDPRGPVAAALGLHRAILKRDVVAPGEGGSEAVADLTDEDAMQYYENLYRIGVGEGQKLFTHDKSLPFDGNLDLVNGVSFNKGCYVGQELTHRTHVMLVVRKRLVPVTFANLTEDMAQKERHCHGNKLVGKSLFGIESQDGKTAASGDSAGRVVAWSGCHGIALLRLPHLHGSLEALFAAGSGNANDPSTPRLRASVPAWWPEEVLATVTKLGGGDSSP